MSEFPTQAEKVGAMAREVAEGAKRHGQHERYCPWRTEIVYFNRLVGHLVSSHRQELLHKIEAREARTK